MATDQWAQWLLSRRDGHSTELRARHAPGLAAFRDGVLERADLRPGDTVLDVGCGTGLIAFGALDQLGPDGRVIFSDVSQELLDECRRRAAADPRCSYVRAAADDLTAFPDASVDVVTTRSVLIYCARKAAAFAEFFRVLRPGGRLSIFEPINRFPAEHRPDSLLGLTGTPVDDLLSRVLAVYRDDGGATRPMVDFDERDVLRWAEAAGFTSVELDYRAQLDVPGEPFGDWPALRRTAPNPLAPTYGEAMAATLTAAERARLDSWLSAQADIPTRRTMATVFLRALRP